MEPKDFKKRTKLSAIRAIRLVEALSDTRVGQVVGKQLIRSATSVGANYRSACRAMSRPSFLAKLTIVEEECDETIY